MPDQNLRPAPDMHSAPDSPRAITPAAPRLRTLPVLLTVLILLLAGVLAWAAWQAYMASPWTRDGAVRAYVVTVAPEVAGRVVSVPVHDNQLVHKGQLLLQVDTTDYQLAVAQAQAAVSQARAAAENAQRQAERRARLSNLETSREELQTYQTTALTDEAAYQQALVALAKARVALNRTSIRSPVNGYVTNLAIQPGDYATVGQNAISLVDADSFWVDGYFEETSLGAIHVGDPALVKLMGSATLLHGRVAGVARGVVTANAAPGEGGLANVNPIFTWVRLAQRVPVRIALDHIPPGVRLVAGETASVQIEPRH